MMKRLIAFGLALLLPLAAFAESTEGNTSEITEDKSGHGIVVMRNRLVEEGDKQKLALDYPSFQGEDSALAAYLNQTITEPFLALRPSEQMAGDEAYVDGNKDFIRSGYFASMDFEGILSIEMTLSSRAAGEKTQRTEFIYHIIDLNGQKELTLYDLFNASPQEVETAIQGQVYERTPPEELAATITDMTQVPMANSYYLMTDVLRCLYAAGTLRREANVVDIPWEALGLEQSAYLTGEGVPQAEPVAQPGDDPDAGLEALVDTLMANDWQYGNALNPSYLRFGQDGVLRNPMGGEQEFVEYYIEDNMLVLDSLTQQGQRAQVSKVGENLLLTFEPGTSTYSILEFSPVSVAGEPQVDALLAQGTVDDTPLQQDTLQQQEPITPIPPVDTPAPQTAQNLAGDGFQMSPVQTPTPMPLSAEDAGIVDVLTHGLWKQMGEDGETYYQFTADGKLLVVKVENYTLQGGRLESDTLSGQILEGGDTAFTLEEGSSQVGYVLNRSAIGIAPEEFVTASPTPVPTPTPEPTPSPTPEPTPEPTPTLSPYEMAKQTAPSLSVQEDASFEKARSLKVYSAPSEDAFRENQWQVTTNDQVAIYGMQDGWVLVSYTIGSGSRGRMGYIDDSTLADPDQVQGLSFVSIDIPLTKNANATDDPLYGKGTTASLREGDTVTLLAFLGNDWAYVETQNDGKTCRVFIPQSSLMEE